MTEFHNGLPVVDGAPDALGLYIKGKYLFLTVNGETVAKRKRGAGHWTPLIPGMTIEEETVPLH